MGDVAGLYELFARIALLVFGGYCLLHQQIEYLNKLYQFKDGSNIKNNTLCILLSLNCGWCCCGFKRKATKRVRKGIKLMEEDFNLRQILLKTHDKKEEGYLKQLSDSEDESLIQKFRRSIG